jgi:hypothetical protein
MFLKKTFNKNIHLANKFATKFTIRSTTMDHGTQLTSTIAIYHKTLERFSSLYLKAPLGIKGVSLSI